MEEISPNSLLMNASQIGATNLLEEALGLGSEIDSFFDDHQFKNMTALMIAAHNGHDVAVRYLIDMGADIQILNESNKDALFFAVQNGHTKVIQSLLGAGAEISSETKKLIENVLELKKLIIKTPDENLSSASLEYKKDLIAQEISKISQNIYNHLISAKVEEPLKEAAFRYFIDNQLGSSVLAILDEKQRKNFDEHCINLFNKLNEQFAERKTRIGSFINAIVEFFENIGIIKPKDEKVKNIIKNDLNKAIVMSEVVESFKSGETNLQASKVKHTPNSSEKNTNQQAR